MARLSVQKLQYGVRARRAAPLRYTTIGRYASKRGVVKPPLKLPVIKYTPAVKTDFNLAAMHSAWATSSLLTNIHPVNIAADVLANNLLTYRKVWRYPGAYGGQYPHHWETTDRSASIGSIQFRYEGFTWPGGGFGDWLEWYIPNPQSGNATWPRLVKVEYQINNGVAIPQPTQVVSLPLGDIVLDPFTDPVSDPRLRPFKPIRFTPYPAVAPAPAPKPHNAVILKLGGNNEPRYRTARHRVGRSRRGDRERKLIAGGKAYGQLLKWIGLSTESLDFVACLAKSSGTYGGPAAYLNYIAKGNTPEVDIDKFVKCLVTNAVEDALIGGVAMAYRKQRRMRYEMLGVDDLPGMKGPAFGTSQGPAAGFRPSF